MKRMHALFAILAMSLVALIARPAGAYVPKGRLFNTLRTERDGSPIVEIGENCKLKQIMDGYGAMYRQATGAELTFRVIRAANPEHTIPVCLVKGDGAMKISRASEKVWENCPADQQSIYLIAGRNDAIRIPMGERAAPESAPSVELVPAVESPEQIQSRKDATCFHNDTCLLNEAKRRDLLPKVQPVPAPVAQPVQPAKESPEQIKLWTDASCFSDDTCLLNEAKRRNILPTVQPAPVPTVPHLLHKPVVAAPVLAPAPQQPKAPSVWGIPLLTIVSWMFVTMSAIAILCLVLWRNAVRDLALKNSVIENVMASASQKLEEAKADAKDAWKKYDDVKGEERKLKGALQAFEDEKPALESLRQQMLRISRDDRKLKTGDAATIRELFWLINSSYLDEIRIMHAGSSARALVPGSSYSAELRDTETAAAREFESFRVSMLNVARNERGLEVRDDMPALDLFITIKRSYEIESRGLRDSLETAKSETETLESKLEHATTTHTNMLADVRQMKIDLKEAKDLTEAAIANRDASERSERVLKTAIREYAMVLQSSSMYERRLIEIRKKTEENSDLLVELKRQYGEYEGQGNQELMSTSERSIKEVNDRLSRLLTEKEDVQERASIKRGEIEAIEEKLGFSFSNEAISNEAGEYRAEALQHLASASATRETLKERADQLQRDLETERKKLAELEALKTDLEGRLADKEKRLALREGTVQSLFTQVLTFCNMDPDADVERIYAAGGPEFLMEQLRMHMTVDLTEENERFQKDLGVANRLVEERNAEILELCKDLDALRAQMQSTDGEKPKEPSDSGVQIRVPTPADLLQHGLGNDPRQAFDFALTLLAALPQGSAFRIESTDDLKRLDKLQQFPIEFPNDPRVLFRKAKLRDHDCGTALSLFKTYFPEPRFKHVPKYLELYGQYLKGFEPEQRRHTMLGIPAQGIGSSIAPTLIPTRPPGTGTGNET